MRTLFISITFSSITFLTQAQCNCQEEFSKIKNHLESNYAGFGDKVTKSNIEQYNQFTAQKEQVVAHGSVYTIYDYTGKSILTGKILSEQSVIDLGDLSKGIYLLSIGENLERTFKVIKE
ncbi:MAG: T9SS type A sorting domain-containing protein [Crocinitomicaceae bacterium]|jgi:hypothetical protein